MANRRAIKASEVHAWHGILAPAADWRAGVHRLLATYLDTDASSIRFGRAPCCQCGDTRHGRPRIDWPPSDIVFNLAHSGRHWLLAVTRGRQVGADIEVPRGSGVTWLARDSLSPAELVYRQSQERSRQDDIFYACWTRKEAVLKACGIGLAVPPRSVEVAPMWAPRARVRFPCAAGPDEWLVEDLAGPKGSGERPGEHRWARWFGAVAQPLAGAGRVTLREAPESDGRDPRVWDELTWSGELRADETA